MTEGRNFQKISISTFLFKILAGLSGGIVGTLILLLIFILFSSISDPMATLQSEEGISAIFIFILIVMIFISSSSGNVFSTFLLSLTEREKYKNKSSSMFQIFVTNVIIFVLMAPVYFLASSINSEILIYAVALHIMISAQISALILEIVSNNKYALLGVYGITFSLIISATIIVGLANLIENPAILLFSALPIVWISIAVIQSLVTKIYGWMVGIYDKDFLSANQYNDEEAGSDFLRRQ